MSRWDLRARTLPFMDGANAGSIIATRNRYTTRRETLARDVNRFDSI